MEELFTYAILCKERMKDWCSSDFIYARTINYINLYTKNQWRSDKFHNLRKKFRKI